MAKGTVIVTIEATIIATNCVAIAPFKAFAQRSEPYSQIFILR